MNERPHQTACGNDEALEITTHVHAANQPGKEQKTAKKAVPALVVRCAPLFRASLDKTA